VKVLGIDPGLERIGWGVVERRGSQLSVVDFGLIKTNKAETPTRLQAVFDEAAALIERTRPDCVATERLFFTKNQTSAIDVAKSLGVVQLAAAQSGLSCTEYSPPEVKLSVVGNGAAEKSQVAYMVVRLLGLQEVPKPDDVADALAVALTHALRAPALVR
jgi:crossover junction endodeoxyribonuclease RuvC